MTPRDHDDQQKQTPVRDEPISDAAHDKLGRAPFATAIADEILSDRLSAGAVVAVMGPWGSGKTSLLNLLRLELGGRVDQFNFNPWFFSGTEQLVAYFFDDLAAQFEAAPDSALRQVGKKLAEYKGVLRPAGWIATALGATVLPSWASQMLQKVLRGAGAAADEIEALIKEHQSGSLKAKRTTLREQFAKLKRRVVIVLDDLDRLRPDEIRDVVRLVRLVCDFPNTVYVLAFDRDRVEHALGEGSTNPTEVGRAYLEKIVEVAFDLPEARPEALAEMLMREIDRIQGALAGIHGPAVQADFTNVFAFGYGMSTLFKTPRDVRRYVNALPVAIRTVGQEVALTDVVALEALRIHVPNFYRALPSDIEVLTRSNELWGRSEERRQSQKERFEALLALAGPHRAAVGWMCRYLFPMSRSYTENLQLDGHRGDWLKYRRVAHEDVLRFYLERTLPSGVVPMAKLNQVLGILNDEAALQAAVAELKSGEVMNLLDRLPLFLDSVRPDAVASVAPVFLRLLSHLPRHTRSFEDTPPLWLLFRVLRRLFERIEDLDSRAMAATEVVRRANDLTQRLVVLQSLGYGMDDQRHALLPRDRLDPLVAELHAAVRAASIQELCGEMDLFALLLEAAGDGEYPDAEKLLGEDGLVLSVLRSAASVGHGGPMDEVAQHRIVQLPWSSLEKLFGAARWKDRVRKIVDSVDGSQADEAVSEALDAAAKWLTSKE